MQCLTTAFTVIRKPILRLCSAIAHHRKQYKNGEFEQSLNRISIGLLLFLYFDRVAPAILAANPVLDVDVRLVGALYLISASIICTSLILWPDGVTIRRICAILLDTGVLTVVLLIGGVHAAPLYFLYLWIIIGNGFRFGQFYLFITLAATLCGFGMVIAVEPYWSAEWRLSIGLWIGTLLISMYFSLLVGRMFTALDQANAANLAKRQFICAVSHELRTPLNAIIGMVDLLRGTKVDSEQSEMLECMTTTSKLMLSQIEDVLDFSKIEAGKMVVEHADFELYALVENILSMFRYRVDLDAVDLVRTIDCTVPAILTGDSHHLRQILVNLIGNAVKFTEQGHIALKIRRLPDSGASIRLRFTIRDTGIGIPVDMQERIFDSFTQADSSTARKYGGTGLGTTICKQLVELMGGQIDFSSTPGMGSEFRFELEFGAKTDVDDVSLLGSAQSLIIGASDDEIRLGFDIATLCKVRPIIAISLEQALPDIERCRLDGYSVSMIFIRDTVRSGETINSWSARLKAEIAILRKASGDHGLMPILLVGEDFPVDCIEEVADLAGFFSVLPSRYDRQMLVNLVRAQSSLSAGQGYAKELPGEMRFRLVPAVPIPASNSDPDCFRVLIVEDNPTNRKVLQMILERAGHQCTLARDGEEALDMIGVQSFDAIVLDLNMPKVTGIEVAKFCKVIGGRVASTPIIMFSASVTQEAREESIKAGADAFMPKPIDVPNFLETLNRLVRGSLSPGPSSGIKSSQPDAMGRNSIEPVLDLEKLSNIETISTDPYFLDELIVEFMTEGRRLIGIVEKGLIYRDWTSVGSALHALRGSALSIGATSLKIICTRIEKIPPNEMYVRRKEINDELNQDFSCLCLELEDYRKHRMKYFGYPKFH
jgi:two-component system sensor histidine kinase RpfC